ncbi:MAG: hypothetical protein ACXQTW_03855, partial [Candidatus Methanospirareceae archaeon]
TSTTLEDTAKDWGTDQWKDAYVEIVDGTGKGQIRKIASNTANTLTVTTAWTTPPDSTSKYRIFGAPAEVRALEGILTQLDVALSTRASESTLSAVKTNTDKLDITLSSHKDSLKPARATPVQELSAQSIPAADKAEFTISDADGYSAVVVTVKAAYDASATKGVRVWWLYSPDGTDFDSEDAAEAEGQYNDIAFVAGATKVETLLIPLFQPYVKVQIENLDPTYAVTVDAWRTLMR